MARSGVDVQLSEHGFSKRRPRQHPADSTLDHSARELRELLLERAGYARGDETREGRRHRMTVALRALVELTPEEQTEALRYMADLKARRSGD